LPAVRAVQSTPLIGSHGKVLGVLSTHHEIPFHQSRENLRVIDYFAKWAAALMEWSDNGATETALLSGQGLAAY